MDTGSSAALASTDLPNHICIVNIRMAGAGGAAALMHTEEAVDHVHAVACRMLIPKPRPVTIPLLVKVLCNDID